MVVSEKIKAIQAEKGFIECFPAWEAEKFARKTFKKNA